MEKYVFIKAENNMNIIMKKCISWSLDVHFFTRSESIYDSVAEIFLE